MAEGTQVYVPQRMVVQLPATKEMPEGVVRVLEPGYQDISDEVLSNHPIIKRLKARSDAAQQRQNELAEMTGKVSIGAAPQYELQQLQAEHQAADLEELNAASEEWNKEAQAAADKGLPYLEPHPDTHVEEAKWITTNAPHVYPTATLVQNNDLSPKVPADGPTAQAPTRVLPEDPL